MPPVLNFFHAQEPQHFAGGIPDGVPAPSYNRSVTGPRMSGMKHPAHYPLKLSFIALAVTLCGVGGLAANANLGKWDEVVGKEITNYQGETLGHLTDTAVDVENGRYVGAIISYGGFLGLGAKTKIVPPGALVDNGAPKQLFLNMTKSDFEKAPVFPLSSEVGPPQNTRVAEVYRYFGQAPYFSNDVVRVPGQNQEQLGYIQRGSRIILMPLENLNGRTLGAVSGLRDLNRLTGRLGGVVIHPMPGSGLSNAKIIPPEALRYNLRHNRLLVNDGLLPFRNTADFVPLGNGVYLEEAPVAPSLPPPPLGQGANWRDKRITRLIEKAILADGSLTRYAKQIEVGTLKGKTTLRGWVSTPAEKARIEVYAAQRAGGENVTSLLSAGSAPRSLR